MRATHVIFDMDGTLVDTSAYTIPACRRASTEFGMPVPSDDRIKTGIGYAAAEFYRYIQPEYPVEALRSYGARVRALEEQGIAALGAGILFPGVVDMLRELKGAGAALYIASTGEREYVDLALRSSGIAGWFDGVHAGEPSKEGMAVQIRRAAPGGVWAFVGDRFKDADAARAAGMPSIFAGWGFSPAAEAALFDLKADTPEELPGLLGFR